MLRPSPNHGTQRLPNDDDDDELVQTRTEILYLLTLLKIKLYKKVS